MSIIAGKPAEANTAGRKAAAAGLRGADGFRAIACLAVFVHHLFLFHARPLALNGGRLGELFLAGNTGVGAFFVLSGFLLSIPFLKAHRATKPMPSLRVYAVRRLSRIVPGYLLCFLTLWMLTRAFASPGGFFQLVTSLSFTNSFFPSTYTPGFDPPLWSISIEMLFYAMLAVVVVGMFRMRSAVAVRVYVVAIVGLIVLFQFFLQRTSGRIEYLVGEPRWFAADSQSVKENAVILFAQFLMGFFTADAMLALESRWPRPSAAEPERRGWNRFDAAAAILLLLVPVLLSGTVSHIPLLWRVWSNPIAKYHWPLLHVLYGAILISLAFSLTIGRWLDTRCFRWTASLSFGIYMWHVPVMDAIARFWPASTGASWMHALVFGLVSLVISYAIAAVSFYLVEAPIMKWAHRK